MTEVKDELVKHPSAAFMTELFVLNSANARTATEVPANKVEITLKVS